MHLGKGYDRMLGSLTENERYYRRMISSIGVSMLSLWLMMNVMGIFLPVVTTMLELFGTSEIWADIIYQLAYGIFYFLTFTIPAILLKAMIGRQGDVYYPTKTEPRFSEYLPAFVLGGIFLIYVQSSLNAMLVSVFDYAAFSEQVLWGEDKIYGYGVVLKFITMAFVPAFCEEFLFRGAILTNLLPFGRTNAIVISALLFAMMHQNAEQVLYAFAAGILLGVLYERTGSIWNCVFLHLMNNFSSLVMSVLSKTLHHDAEIGSAFAVLLMCLVCGVGVVFLVRFLSQKKGTLEDGIFEKSYPPTDSYATCKLESGRIVSLFFTVPMILFLALSVAQMITLIWMAVMYQYA